ncbi:MAG: ComEC/Rec2 family competence protein [Pyrinomonadaceae bacterium]|nr:ComEC/Rec2 family competence protein [Pyrinomonadaceae bacterium]
MAVDRKIREYDRQPLTWLAAVFAGGILLANLVNFPSSVSIALCLFSGITALILRAGRIATAFALLAFFSAGMIAVGIERAGFRTDRVRVLLDNGSIATGAPIVMEGVLSRSPEPRPDGLIADIDASKITFRRSERSVSGRVRLYVPLTNGVDNADQGLGYGTSVRVACRISRDDGFLDPGVKPRRQLLDRIGIDATCNAKSRLLVEPIAEEQVFVPLKWAYEARAGLIDVFRRELSQPAAGVMIASLLGNKFFLDKRTADLFREGGIFHILVISGLHITFIGGLLLLFIRLFTDDRWIQFGVTVVVMWSYTFAVGGDLPVVRATIMFTVLLFSFVIYRQGGLLNSLGGCAIALLVWQPSAIFDPSFQLTFVSVGAIVVLAYPIIEMLRRIGSWTPTTASPFPPNVPAWLARSCEIIFWNPAAWSIEAKQQIWSAVLYRGEMPKWLTHGGLQRALRNVIEGLIVSTVVQVCMLPLSVVYFHRVSLSAVILNLWVGLFIAIESFAAVLGAVLLIAGRPLAVPFFRIAEFADSIMLAAPGMMSDNGWASFRLPAYAGHASALYLFYFVPILILAFGVAALDPFKTRAIEVQWRRAMAVAGGSAVLMAALIIFHPFSAGRPDGNLHLDILDVGQGDAALVTFPNGTTMLVDGGGRFDYRDNDPNGDDFEPDVRGIGESVVSEVLWHKGLSGIDYILATHADADHIQGLTDIAGNFSVKKALIARLPLDDPDFAAFAEKVRRRGITTEFAARGDVLRIDGVTVEVLLPAADERQNTVWGNDQSIVLRISMGSFAFLLTGDIESAAERELVTGGGTLRANLVKVPHHGSRTSSTDEFIRAVGATQAVISVGRSSPFGHPHPEVVGRWRAAGANVLTTGERGMISISTNGREMWMQAFVP